MKNRGMAGRVNKFANLAQRVRGVQVKVELEYVHARLTEKSELPLLGMFRHYRAHFVFLHPSFPRYTWNLKFRRRGRNVRIEPRAGCGCKVYRNGRAGSFC